MICMKITDKNILSSSKINTKQFTLKNNFVEYLHDNIRDLQDFIVFVVTVEYVVIPTNQAIKAVPSDDVKYAMTAAKNIMDVLGKQAVGKLLMTWDQLGVDGCLNVERHEVISEFTKLRTILSVLPYKRTEIEDNSIMTAFVQEFERRAGQKRKNRAGTSLEDFTDFLFDYYCFKSHKKPDHFQTDIEVDKWFRCSDGWSIGISCKRTLRERWKQVSSADSNALSRYKIKEIWHLLTYDKDLSDDKITMLGQQRQIFYLMDDSPVYQRAKDHVGMKDYVRPLSFLIDDIAKEQNVKLKKP